MLHLWFAHPFQSDTFNQKGNSAEAGTQVAGGRNPGFRELSRIPLRKLRSIQATLADQFVTVNAAVMF